MVAQPPAPPNELQALPGLFLRHGVQQLGAANALVGRQAIAATVPQARGLLETVANMLFIDQDATGNRAVAYVAYSIASEEAEAETHVPGTISAETRLPLWSAAVGEFPSTDTSALKERLKASRDQIRDTRVARHLETILSALPAKIGRTEWSSVLDHGTLVRRAEALTNGDHYVALYRTMYRVLSRDAHANGVLDGLVHNEAGEAHVLGVYDEHTSKAEAVLDAITGLGLNLIDHALETHLGNDRQLAKATAKIRRTKRTG